MYTLPPEAVLPGATYFGEPWPSGICEEDYSVQVPTPTGVKCIWCQEPIKEGDQGSFIGNALTRDEKQIQFSVKTIFSGTWSPQHKECSLRSVIGSIAHLRMGEHATGECNDALDAMEITAREDALLVWEHVQAYGFQPYYC